MRVSRSGFLAWRKREPSGRALEDAALTDLIKVIHEQSLDKYGAPRIHIELREDHGVRVGRKRGARLMRVASIHRASTGGVSAPRAILGSAWRCSGMWSDDGSSRLRLTGCGWRT